MALTKISQAIGKPTGYVNPRLYEFGKSSPEVYNDVSVGDNTDSGIKGYPAKPGYDLSTGWG